MTPNVGTQGLKAPEVEATDPMEYSFPADVFSYGVTTGPFNPLPDPGNRPFGRKWNIAPVCPGSPPSTIPVFPPVD